MAINLSGFLGGLGEGFGSYQKEQQVKKNTQFEKDSELERQRLARLADQRGQDAVDRQAKSEERLLAQSEYNQGLGIFNQIQEIARADADDDVTTGRFLRSPGLDEASRQQEVQGRLQRYNQRQTLIKQLSGQGKVTQTFGDVSTLLRPTQFGTPDFKMPKPMIDPAQLRSMTDAELQKIIKAPGAQKPDATAQARQRLGYYADQSYLDANVPEFGKNLGFGGPTGSKALENPAQFFQQNTDFKTGVGGERILPTGAKQVVKYVNGVPTVEYQRPLKADYVEPQAEALKSGILNRQLEFLTRTMDSRTAKSLAEAEKVRWSNLLAGKQYAWYDKIAGAKAAKLRSNGSGASDSLRRLSIMLAHNDRVAALGQRKQEFELNKTEAWQKTVKEFDDNLRGLEKERDDLKQAVGKSTDFGLGGSREAARQGVDRLTREIDTMRAQGARVKTLNLGAASEVIGTNFTPAAQLDATTMYADQQAQQQQALMAMQMGMAGPRYQQQPAPQAPAQGPMIFSPNINLGGMQGGAGMPGAAGGGGAIGGGGVLPNQGGKPVLGKDGKPLDPAAQLAAILAALQAEGSKGNGKPGGKRPNNPVGPDGFLVDATGREYRKDKNGRVIYVDADGKDLGGPLPAPPPLVKPRVVTTAGPEKPTGVMPANYEGWLLNGVPYNGPRYQNIAMSKSQYDAMSAAADTDEKDAAFKRKLATYKLTYRSKPRGPAKLNPNDFTNSGSYNDFGG